MRIFKGDSSISQGSMALLRIMSRVLRYYHPNGETSLLNSLRQIVLADGTITDANAQQNSDLFWALKGGGSNFGDCFIRFIFIGSL